MALRHLVVTYPVYQAFSLNANAWRMHIKCLLNKSTSFPLPHLCFFHLPLLVVLFVRIFSSKNRTALCAANKNQNQPNKSISSQTFVHALGCKRTCVTPCAIHIRALIEAIISNHRISEKFVRRRRVQSAFFPLSLSLSMHRQMSKIGWCTPMLKWELEHVFGRLVDENTQNGRKCAQHVHGFDLWVRVCLRIWYTRLFPFPHYALQHAAQVATLNSDKFWPISKIHKFIIDAISFWTHSMRFDA